MSLGALYLTAIAINEQKYANSKNKPLKFIEIAKQEDINGILLKLKDKPDVEPHADLIWWINKV